MEAKIADTSFADGLLWPSPLPGICRTGATRWGEERGGMPLFEAIFIASDMVPKYFCCNERSSERRLYVKYGTMV